MAYKFQLGAFTASGSLTTEGNLLAKDSALSGSSLSIGGVALTATPAELNVLDGLAQGRILVGDGSDAASILDASGDTKMLIGNGTTLTSVALSGDINVANDGTATIQANAVEGSMLNSNTVSGAINLADNKLGLTGSALGDGLNFEGDHSHVEQIFVDIESLGALGGTGVAQADNFMFSDSGDLKKITFSNLEDAIFGNVNGDATVAAGGALTIAANAVEGSMLNSNTVSGAINLANDKLGLSGSVAGPGLTFSGDHSHLTALEIQLDSGNGGAAQLQVGANGLSVRSNIAGNGLNMESNILVLDGNGLTESAGLMQTADKIVFVDASNSNATRKLSFANMRDAVLTAVSGDATIATGGALTIAANAVEGTMLNSNVVSGAINLADNKLGLTGSALGDGLNFEGDHSHVEQIFVDIESLGALGGTGIAQADNFMFSDSGDLKKVTFSNLEDAIFGNVNGDATVAAGGALTIASNAVEGSMLNSNVVSGAINLADNKLGLSGSIAGNGLKFQNALQNGFGDHSHIEKLAVQLETTNALSVSSNGIDLKGTIAGDRTFSGDVKVGGDLYVDGTTITVNSTSIMITGSLVFEGATANNFETTLGVVDPTADRTINLANVGGTLIPFAAASTTAIAATPAELNLMDSDTAIGSEVTDLADSDGIIVEDGDTMKKVALSSIKTYIGNTSNLDVSLKENGNAFAVGVNYFANLAGATSGSLPASPTVGDAVYVKAPANCSSTNTLQIACVGSHQIDGADEITLESPHAAVMCVYVVANVWKVF